MSKSCRSFTVEYKVEAAHRVIDTSRTVSEVGGEIGVGEQLLGRWVRDGRVRTEAATANGTAPLTGAVRAELVRLRQQVADQKDDLAFLKKRQRNLRPFNQSDLL